ncbi:permeases of the major facilitator [Zymobacter palmae]|uniref:Permeases of the major facilitator n=1 Tax=Zymobacter palmae TaxID=33074 RepID=A0A348HEC9_9GAMM|nr:permeases of the major facilitator [Zymobacter palmae]
MGGIPVSPEGWQLIALGLGTFFCRLVFGFIDVLVPMVNAMTVTAAPAAHLRQLGHVCSSDSCPLPQHPVLSYQSASGLGLYLLINRPADLSIR